LRLCQTHLFLSIIVRICYFLNKNLRCYALMTEDVAEVRRRDGTRSRDKSLAPDFVLKPSESSWLSLPKTPSADHQRSKPCSMRSCLRSNPRAALVIP
jgi:hypothetical protein